MPHILFLSLRAGKMSHIFLKSAQPQDSDLTSCPDAEGSGLGWGVQGPAPSASGPGSGARASREHLTQPGTGRTHTTLDCTTFGDRPRATGTSGREQPQRPASSPTSRAASPRAQNPPSSPEHPFMGSTTLSCLHSNGH